MEFQGTASLKRKLRSAASAFSWFQRYIYDARSQRARGKVGALAARSWNIAARSQRARSTLWRALSALACATFPTQCFRISPGCSATEPVERAVARSCSLGCTSFLCLAPHACSPQVIHKLASLLGIYTAFLTGRAKFQAVQFRKVISAAQKGLRSH